MFYINLSFFTVQVVCSNFLYLYGRYAVRYETSLSIFSATDRIKINSDQKRFFITLGLYPLSFLANTPFNKVFNTQRSKELQELGFIFKTGLSLKCRDAFAFEFTFITHFYFCVALVMYFLEVQKTCFLVVIGKLIIDVSVRALDPCKKNRLFIIILCLCQVSFRRVYRKYRS